MAQIHLQHLDGKKYRLSFPDAVILHAHAFTDFKHSIQEFYCPLPRDFTQESSALSFVTLPFWKKKRNTTWK